MIRLVLDSSNGNWLKLPLEMLLFTLDAVFKLLEKEETVELDNKLDEVAVEEIVELRPPNTWLLMLLIVMESCILLQRVMPLVLEALHIR